MAKLPGKTSKTKLDLGPIVALPKAPLKTWVVTHKFPVYVAEGKEWNYRITEITGTKVNFYAQGAAAFFDETGDFTAYIADVLTIEEKR